MKKKSIIRGRKKLPQLIAAVIAVAAVSACARDNVLFLGAHPDDFEACCGLALRMKDDFNVHIIDFTRGEGGCGEVGFRDGSTARKRVAEEREVAKTFGTDPVFLSQVNFKGRYAFANEQVTKEIEELLLKYRPRAVFTNWPVDTHPDHVQCTAAAEHAVWNVRRDAGFSTEVYYYEEPPWETMNYRPVYYVDVTDEIGTITNLVGRYVCQNGAKIARNKVDRMANRGREAPIKVPYAETFSTRTGRPIPGGILDRYCLRKPLLVLHLDFNTIQMKKETVIDCLRVGARAGYNAVLWEVEDKIRWETCPECVHPDAFTKDEFREILAEAKRLGLEPIPLLQTFGHAEYVLVNGKHQDWMEDPKFPACYCVSNSEVRDFLQRFLREYLDLFGEDVKHFHLGGDEAKAFATCPTCSKQDRMGLYVNHLKSLSNWLLLFGIKPGIWCDMVLGDVEAFRKAHLPSCFTVWLWDYVYDDLPGGRRRMWTDKMDVLKDLGHDVVFSVSSASCGDGPFLPNYGAHGVNVAAGAARARRENLRGLCMTSWSVRKFPKSLQYPLWDYAARRFLSPAFDTVTDERAAFANYFPSVGIDALRMLTAWDVRLVDLDGSGWWPYIKNAQPAPKGTLERLVHECGPNYLPSLAARAKEIEESIDRNVEALSVSEPAAETLRQGVSLTRRFLSEVRRIDQDIRPDFGIRDETAIYFGLEQTEGSASNCADIVWSVMENR